MGSILTAAARTLAIATLAFAIAADAAAQASWPNVVEKGRTSSSPPAKAGAPDSANDAGLQDRGTEPGYPGGLKPTGVARRIDPFDRNDEAELADSHSSGDQEVIVCLAGCEGAPGPVGQGK